jgi:CheY-like chemotaxis protein
MNFKDEKTLLVYLVDDDPDDQHLFSEALSKISRPVNLTILNNGVELMDKLFTTDQLPDMVFLDLYMPMMDGEECLQDIREEKKFNKIPILIYSNSFDINRIGRLFEMGANRFLQKPVSFSSLVSLLDRIIRSLIKNGLGGPTAYHIN